MSREAHFDTSGEEQSLLVGRFNAHDQHDTARRDRQWIKSLVGAVIVGVCLGVSLAYVFAGSFHSVDTLADGVQESLEASLLGAQKKHHHKDKNVDEADAHCNDGKYSKRTLKLAYELPFAALFWGDPEGVRKYEASDVILVDDYAYAVCDSSWAIAKFNAQLSPFAVDNVPIYDLGDSRTEQEEGDSGYEAILHENGTFYVIRESVQHEDSAYRAIVEELNVEEDQDAYTINSQCSTEFEFEGSSKGFEGAVAVYDLNKELVILGLCEGNYCSEEKKKERGNGRMVAMRKILQEDGTCTWATIRTINIPESVDFLDYSAATISESGRIGITSQEDSKFWVGQLLGKVVSDSGEVVWDVDAMEFDSNIGSMFDFPKNDLCQTIYCNIEGIHWINDDMVMAVSDKMKSKGKQDFQCFDKDQSVHVFILPA